MFRIEWAESAVADLSDRWDDGDPQLQAYIIAALLDVRQQLSVEPDRAGESREPGARLLIVPPLAVTFHVNVRTNIVLVAGVRVAPPRE